MSVSFIFFVNGFVVASWLPHIPEVKERLRLGDFQLGIALFAMAAGSVLVLPLAGWLAARYGSRMTTRQPAWRSACCCPLRSWRRASQLLILALLLFGAANGMLDVAMNSQAIEVEDRYRRPILSSLHGLYSTGGLAGAGLAALAAWAGIPAARPCDRRDCSSGSGVVCGNPLSAAWRGPHDGSGRRAGVASRAPCSASALWRSWR